MKKATTASTIIFTLLFGMCRIGLAATNADAIPVVDFTGLKGFQAYVNRNTADELSDAIRQQGLAVFGRTLDFELNGNRYCIAEVGLTHAEKKDRNPRIPAETFQRYSFGPANKTNAFDCRAAALQGALADLNSTDMNDVLHNIDSTESDARERAQEPADKDMMQMTRSGLSDAGQQAVFKVMSSYPISEIFDYRQVQTSISVVATQFKNGLRMCVATVGLAARSTDSRNSRFPGSRVSAIQTQMGGDEAQCRTDAAINAVRILFDSPWTAHGILEDFSRAREDGIPLPNTAQVAKMRAASLSIKHSTPKVAQSKQTNAPTCSNDCVNGSCVRTFPDGRKEKWQAPRVMDRFSGEWKWDTSSCGG